MFMSNNPLDNSLDPLVMNTDNLDNCHRPQILASAKAPRSIKFGIKFLAQLTDIKLTDFVAQSSHS